MMNNNVSIINYDKCYGCELCSSICPYESISMVSDMEGFIRPHINFDKCINCGACLKHCPVENIDKIQLSTHNQRIFALSLSNTNSLKKSSSGGASYAIMRAAMKLGYIVYGVSYDEDYRGCHYQRAENISELDALRGTKYIQSRKNGVYKDIQKCLQEEKQIVFIGLPCEVAAVKLFLNNNYDNIIFVELICHGVTSPKVSEQYIDAIEKKYGKLTYFNLRYKKYGWTPPCIKIDFANNQSFSKLFDSTAYGYAFRNFSRPSCYFCDYKGNKRVADITIGDYWGIKRDDKCWNPEGVSIVFVHTNKGNELVNMLDNVNIYPVMYEQAINNNSYINKPRERGIRDEYSKAFINSNIFYARKKTENIKQKIIRILRDLYYLIKSD